MSNITLSAAASLIAEKKKMLIITHARPDGDTLGSAYGLKHAIAKYCDARVICADPVPDRLKFITEGEIDLSDTRLGDFSPEMIVSIDTAETKLMGDHGARYGAAIDLKIDHHPLGTEYGRYNYIDGEAAATGELIFKLVLELQAIGAGELNKRSATALYAAISSDTGSFKFTNTTPDTLLIASALMQTGADTETVNHCLYECKSANEVVASKLTLNGMNVYRRGTVVAFSITNKMKEDHGLSDDDFGGVIDILREIDGVDLAITIKQNSDAPEKFRLSLRSRGEIYANKLCAMFEGGGHARAAGGSITADSPEEAEHTVIQKILAEIGYDG